MTYLIDAWLDRPHPYLRILHRETGERIRRSKWARVASGFHHADCRAFINDV